MAELITPNNTPNTAMAPTPSLETTNGTESPSTPQQPVQANAISNTTAKTTRAGRRPKFNSSDDLVLIREVAAAKAHVAPNGETKERFEIAAARANATKKLSCPVTWKNVQDRYKRLQARFDKDDAREALMSGVGGEVGEMEELLSSMTEARDDKEKDASEKRKAVKEKDAKKERMGAVIREQAVKRRRERANKTQSSSEDGDDESPKKKRLGESIKEGFDSELRQFTETLARGDAERNRIDQEKLKLDRDRFEEEKEERQRDRQERKEDKEATQEMELQKFKAMLELLGKSAGHSATPK